MTTISRAYCPIRNRVARFWHFFFAGMLFSEEEMSLKLSRMQHRLNVPNILCQHGRSEWHSSNIAKQRALQHFFLCLTKCLIRCFLAPLENAVQFKFSMEFLELFYVE